MLTTCVQARLLAACQPSAPVSTVLYKALGYPSSSHNQLKAIGVHFVRTRPTAALPWSLCEPLPVPNTSPACPHPPTWPHPFGSTFTEQALFRTLASECARHGLRYRQKAVRPVLGYHSIAGREGDYEGGFALMAIDHEDAPGTEWHRSDFAAPAWRSEA